MTSLDVNYVTIDAARVDHICDAFFKWKDLNTFVKQQSTRGINMPDVISEQMACYCLGFLWNRGSVVGDATDPKGDRRIEFKATSRFEGDLSSFGPDCIFDDLYFLRFNTDENLLFIYDLNVNSYRFSELPANQRETIGQQQEQGRRPHVSLQKLFVDEYKLQPTCIFDIRRMKNFNPGDSKYEELLELCSSPKKSTII